MNFIDKNMKFEETNRYMYNCKMCKWKNITCV